MESNQLATPLAPPVVSEINYSTVSSTAMYLKSFIFLLCAYSFISAKPVSVSLSSDDNMAERPTSINRPSGDGGDPLKPTLTTDKDKRRSGSSSVTSGDGSDNSVAMDQVAGGNAGCNVGNYSSLLTAIQLNPLYAFSVMAELQHAQAASRRKRQGSVDSTVIPHQTCRDLLSKLNTNSSRRTSTQVVACPVVYRCDYNPTRYPRYLIQAESCHQVNYRCAEQNVTVNIAEFEGAGSCNWNELSIQIRVGCYHNIRRSS